MVGLHTVHSTGHDCIVGMWCQRARDLLFAVRWVDGAAFSTRLGSTLCASFLFLSSFFAGKWRCLPLRLFYASHVERLRVGFCLPFSSISHLFRRILFGPVFRGILFLV